MKKNAIRTPVVLMILAILLLADVGLVRARNIDDAESLALKGKLLFQENFATPTSFTKQLQTIHDGCCLMNIKTFASRLTRRRIG